MNFPQTWGSLPSFLDQAFANNFEEGMELIWKSIDLSQNIAILMRNMGYYFAQFGLRKKTNNLYFKFLESFKDSIGDILFSSLNYDLILELAAGINGFLIDYFSQTPGINKISILKLHGSCNFLLGQLEATGSITFTAGVTFSSGLKAVNPNEAMALCQSNTALYPAMCLYMKSKETQIGYDELIAVQARWRERVLDAEKVVIIGVRPYPDDKHIWEPLSQTNAKLGYIGSEDAFNQWMSSYRTNKNNEMIGDRWDSYLSQSIDFLRSSIK